MGGRQPLGRRGRVQGEAKSAPARFSAQTASIITSIHECFFLNASYCSSVMDDVNKDCVKCCLSGTQLFPATSHKWADRHAQLDLAIVNHGLESTRIGFSL